VEAHVNGIILIGFWGKKLSKKFIFLTYKGTKKKIILCNLANILILKGKFRPKNEFLM
jgi:hypothetical protein